MLWKTAEEKERLIRDDVEREGWSLIYVIDEQELEPPFAYSVGFFSRPSGIPKSSSWA